MAKHAPQPTFFPAFERADLSRGADAPTSQEAFEKLRPYLGTAQAELHAWLLTQREAGGTSLEFALYVGKPRHSVSGRFTELGAAGLIRKSGRRRDDSNVWIAVETTRRNGVVNPPEKAAVCLDCNGTGREQMPCDPGDVRCEFCGGTGVAKAEGRS